MSITEFLLVFVGIALSDVFWVYCVRSIQGTDPVAAGMWAVAIFLPTALTTVAYVENKWLMLPAMLGHFFGTFAPVYWEKRKKQKQEDKAKKIQDGIAAILARRTEDDLAMIDILAKKMEPAQTQKPELDLDLSYWDLLSEKPLPSTKRSATAKK